MAVPSLRSCQTRYSMVVVGLSMASCLMMLMWLYGGSVLQTHSLELSEPIENEYTTTGDHMKGRVTPRQNNADTTLNAVPTQDLVTTANGDIRSDTLICAAEKRLNIVEEVCSTLSNRDLAVKESDYDDSFQTYINHEQRVFCCIISKGGSRALGGYFARLNKLDATFVAHNTNMMPRPDLRSMSVDEMMKLQGFNSVRNIPLEEVQRLFHNYTKLMQVRHPLQRFVSGYYEKVFDMTLNADFPGFVEKVLNGYSNRHWMPYYTNTFPCLLHYDIIIKVETSEHDQHMLKDRFGWESTIAHGQINRNLNITDPTRSDYYKYDDFLQDFAIKHPSLFNRLLAFLQPDMDMFGYTWDEAGSSCYSTAAKCC